VGGSATAITASHGESTSDPARPNVAMMPRYSRPQSSLLPDFPTKTAVKLGKILSQFYASRLAVPSLASDRSGLRGGVKVLGGSILRPNRDHAVLEVG
jgi:hypothetical protein